VDELGVPDAVDADAGLRFERDYPDSGECSAQHGADALDEASGADRAEKDLGSRGTQLRDLLNQFFRQLPIRRGVELRSY
jgi:hypothetical protein